jgi:hypothetical protein
MTRLNVPPKSRRGAHAISDAAFRALPIDVRAVPQWKLFWLKGLTDRKDEITRAYEQLSL